MILRQSVYISIDKKRLFNNAPAIEQRSSGFKNWLSIRTSYPHAESEWVFLSVRGIRFLGNSFTILSRLLVVCRVVTGDSSAHVTSFVWFCLANMGIDTRLIQDYLGHRNIVILSGIPPAMQGVFTASGIDQRTTASRCFIEIVEIPGMV